MRSRCPRIRGASRTVSAVDPCFFCHAPLVAVRHEHDHFPIPWRHGGRETVPTCARCHDIKERIPLHRWSPAQIAAGDEGLTWKGVLWVQTILARLDDDEIDDEWLTEDPSAVILRAVQDCTTTEARLAMAMCWSSVLDHYGYQHEKTPPPELSDEGAIGQLSFVL